VTAHDDLWRCADVPAAAIVQLAEADAFRPSLRLAWREEALWAIKALRDEPLPLFAAASVREAMTDVFNAARLTVFNPFVPIHLDRQTWFMRWRPTGLPDSRSGCAATRHIRVGQLRSFLNSGVLWASCCWRRETKSPPDCMLAVPGRT
jgi:hypothetical protein